MSENFIIRKNKSQKVVNFHQKLQKKSPSLLGTQQMSKCRDPKVINKLVRLQPLLKAKDSIHYLTDKSTQSKHEYTQPASYNSSSLNQNESKLEGLQLLPLEVNFPLRTNHFEKENRPASMNELKYPNIIKLQTSLSKTEKFQSLKLLAHLTDGMQKMKFQREIDTQSIKRKNLTQKLLKMNLQKTSSRSTFAKINGRQHSNDNTIVYHSEVGTESNSISQLNFKKGVINKLLKQIKKYNNQRNLHLEQCQNSQKYISKNQDQKPIEEVTNSPILKKDQCAFVANCSTIKEQEESSSSFISSKGFQELICGKTMDEMNPLNQDKPYYDRRLKIEVDKMKKKFPQNFFK